MKRIRIGKDISMRWEITTDGVAIPLDGRDLTVEIKSPNGIENNIPYRIDGNILIMTYYGYEQKMTGEYSITLWEKKGKPGQNVVDVIRAFELVRTSQKEDDFVGGDLQIESVDLGTENFDILTEGGYRAINIDTLQAEALEDSVNIKGKTYSNESFTITLPKANLDSAGVMSASDVRTLKEHADSIAQIKTSCEENAADIERVSNVVDTHESRLGGIDAEISSLNTEVSAMQSKVDENTTSISQINNNIADNNKSIAQINTTLEEHTESINAKITTDRIENGAVTTEKIATNAFDSTLSKSEKIAPADVVGLRIAEATNRQITPEMLSESTKQYIEATSKGTITNLLDDEDITQVDNHLKFADKDYLPTSYSGLGRVYLRKIFVDGKNVLTQDMISNENTIYIIQYDYDLNGQEITVPKNCVLKFEGGSFSNGGIIFTETKIVSSKMKIFDNLTSSGQTVNSRFYAEWFGASATNEDNCFDINYAVRFINNLESGGTLVLSDSYVIKDTILLYPKVSLVGVFRNTPLYTGDGFEKLGSSLKADFADPNKWIIDATVLNDGTTFDFDDLNPKYNNNIEWFNNRKTGITIQNLDIININYKSNYIFGGIRISQMFNSCISNVSVCYTMYGVAFEYGWQNVFSNIRFLSYYCSVYLGVTATANKFDSIECTGLTPTYLLPENKGSFVDGVKLMPPYADISKVSIIAEGAGSDMTNAVFNNCIFQYFDAILVGHYNSIIINSPYIERINKTLLWTYDGNYVLRQSLLNNKNIAGYEFGTESGVISAYNIKSCKCYEGTKSFSDLKLHYYIYGEEKQLLYYDNFVVESGAFSSLSRTKSKWVEAEQNLKNVFISPQGEVNESTITGNPTLRIGYDYYNSTTFEEVIKRGYNNITIYQSVCASFKGTPVLKNVSYKFSYLKGTDYLVNSVRIDEAIKIDDSNIEFDINVKSMDAVTHLVDIYGGNNTIKFNADIISKLPLFDIKGDCAIDLYLPNNTYNSIDKFLLDKNTPFNYMIRVHVGESITEYSNSEQRYPYISSRHIATSGKTYHIVSMKRNDFVFFELLIGARIYNSIRFSAYAYNGLSYDIGMLYTGDDITVSYTQTNQGTAEELYDIYVTFSKSMNFKLLSDKSIKPLEVSDDSIIERLINLRVLSKGATFNRPTLQATNEGFEYYDSTLKKKILWNGTAWVNMDGTALT